MANSEWTPGQVHSVVYLTVNSSVNSRFAVIKASLFWKGFSQDFECGDLCVFMEYASRTVAYNSMLYSRVPGKDDFVRCLFTFGQLYCHNVL